MTMAGQFAVMTLTDAAVDRVREIVDAAGDPAVFGVRVGIKNGGCAGMSYTLDVARSVAPGDERVDAKGATVLVEAKAVLYLLGTEMDFERTTLKTGFVFHNPNEVGACGCGESVSLKPVEA